MLVLSETVLVLEKIMMMSEPIFDQEGLAALGCASIHDILVSFDSIDAETNHVGRSTLKRIVSLLTRRIQRTENLTESSIEYEYREAEYEYEESSNKALAATPCLAQIY